MGFSGQRRPIELLKMPIVIFYGHAKLPKKALFHDTDHYISPSHAEQYPTTTRIIPLFRR